MNNHFRPQLIYSLAAVILSLVLYGIISYTQTWYFQWLVAASLVTFGLYGFDKTLTVAQAGLGQTRRTPDLAFHLMSLLGGFLGAWIGILFFRHKSNFRQDPQFLIIIILSTILHAAFIYWYYFARNQPPT